VCRLRTPERKERERERELCSRHGQTGNGAPTSSPASDIITGSSDVCKYVYLFCEYRFGLTQPQQQQLIFVYTIYKMKIEDKLTFNFFFKFSFNFVSVKNRWVLVVAPLIIIFFTRNDAPQKWIGFVCTVPESRMLAFVAASLGYIVFAAIIAAIGLN